MLADKSYNERVQAGKAREEQILNRLRQAGMNILAATADEDMHDKIDGWIVDRMGGKRSLQVKFREGGDDILFEIVKDLDKGIMGRDMICQAEFYVIVNSRGVGRLFETAPIKKWAGKLHEMVKKDLATKPEKVNWVNTSKPWGPWEVKITVDKAHGNRKLMGYFSPGMFVTIGEWKF